jgi:hypothetical protein
MRRSGHPLFRAFPRTGEAHTSRGPLPTPYHIYDGYGVFIGGVADFAAVQQLLAHEEVTPVRTTTGQALMGLWLCDFSEANLGPHHELQFSIFVARQPITDLPSHPLALLKIMLTRPDVQMLCHGLWNNTADVVTYNRELLSLNARLSSSTLVRNRQVLTFAVQDAETDAPLCRGALSHPMQASLVATWQFVQQLGFVQSWQATQRSWISMGVVNPVGVVLPHNAVAQAHTKNDANRIRLFRADDDVLTIQHPTYAALDFQPHFVQHMDGFKFVYLMPAPEQT